MRRVLILTTLLGTPLVATSEEWSGYITLTSDYVKRGVSQSDEHAALQLGGEVSFEWGGYIGLWGSTIDIDNGPTRHRDSEVNLYAGYGADVSPRVRLSAYAVAYNYPGQSGNVDYDYIEYTISANLDDRYWLEYSYSPDLYNTGNSTRNIEALTEFPLGDNWRLNGGVGRYDTSNLTSRAYTYWQLGLAREVSWADINLSYHDTSRDVPIVSTPDRAAARLVLSITIPF